MKTINQLKQIIVAFLLFTSVMFFNACQKEDADLPANAPATDQNATPELNTAERNANYLLYPPNACVNGSNYAAWSAKWWKWALEYPVTGHPFVDDPSFKVNCRQSGNVWFLATPFGMSTVTLMFHMVNLYLSGF